MSKDAISLALCKLNMGNALDNGGIPMGYLLTDNGEYFVKGI